MKSALKTLAWLGLIFTPINLVQAGDVIQARMVRNDNDVFEVTLDLQLNADAKHVYQRLIDFNHLSRLSTVIKSSKLISGQSPEYIVQVVSEGCVMLFCKTVQQLQRVTELGDGHILVEDIAGKSDFAYASVLWQVKPQPQGTRVSFLAEMKPDFWLPPLIGSWLFRKKMLTATQQMILRLEKSTNDK